MPGILQDRQNKWAHLVSDLKGSIPTPVQINQDANLFIAEVDTGKSVTMDIQKGRQAYLLCIEGSCEVSGGGKEGMHVNLNKIRYIYEHKYSRQLLTSFSNQFYYKESLSRHDAAEIVGPMTLVISPLSSSTTSSPFPGVHVLIVDMKFSGDGRTDL